LNIIFYFILISFYISHFKKKLQPVSQFDKTALLILNPLKERDFLDLQENASRNVKAGQQKMIN